MKNPIKKWLDDRAWVKKYGMPVPKWIDYDLADPRIYNDPTYHEWLSKLNDDERIKHGEMMQFVDQQLDRLSLALDNELIKRGRDPDKENI